MSRNESDIGQILMELTIQFIIIRLPLTLTSLR